MYKFTIVRVQTSEAQSLSFNNIANLQAAQMLYSTNQSGPLSASSQPGIGFERLNSSELETLGANELVITNRSDQRHVIYFQGTTAYPNILVGGIPLLINQSCMSLTSVSVAPLSRGNITLQSVSITDPPLIDPGVSTRSLSGQR